MNFVEQYIQMEDYQELCESYRQIYFCFIHVKTLRMISIIMIDSTKSLRYVLDLNIVKVTFFSLDLCRARWLIIFPSRPPDSHCRMAARGVERKPNHMDSRSFSLATFRVMTLKMTGTWIDGVRRARSPTTWLAGREFTVVLRTVAGPCAMSRRGACSRRTDAASPRGTEPGTSPRPPRHRRARRR